MGSMPESNPRLVGIFGPFKGISFLLPEAEVAIGRDPANPLWVADPALSRRHCVVTRHGEQVSIRDLGSHNGTLINGVPITERALQHKDQLSLGDSVLVFLALEEEATGDLEVNTVELSDTSDLGTALIELREEDALYLHPERQGALPTERTARDLKTLLKIATGIGAIRDRDSLDWQLLGMIFDAVPAERGAMLHFVPGSADISHSTAWDRLQGPGHPVRVSRTVLRRVFRDRAGLLTSDVASDKVFSGVETLAQLGVYSLLCVPLLVSGELIGVIYLDRHTPAQQFDKDHLQFMTAVASLASLALDNARHWERLREENRILLSEINLEHNMVGNSPRIREVFQVIHRVAPTDSTVLIQGESGTGKELVARAVHRNSLRAEHPFVAINCAAVTETLLESELFGHEKGSFTGAFAQKKGKLEVADGGTLFLDEIGELSLGLQAKLLRVLQERELERVGGTRPIKIDVRLVAATNRPLADAVQSGKFRSDLFYRLNVVALTMPPLRERKDDIPALAEHFIAKHSKKSKIHVKPLSNEARAYLAGYDWPGNVRELENAIEHALVLGRAETILPEDLPESVLESSPEAGSAASAVSARFHGAVKDSKKQLILQAMQQANGNYIEAARTLGLHPNSLLRLIRNLGLKAATKNLGNSAAD
jgi:transcriptional regulator with GAF, ATPase, and Fis domain